jgi:hypothetical protein
MKQRNIGDVIVIEARQASWLCRRGTVRATRELTPPRIPDSPPSHDLLRQNDRPRTSRGPIFRVL